MKQERENICSLVTDAVLLLCKNGLSFGRGIKIQGLLGITVDDGEVLLIQICETLPAEEKFNEYGVMPSCTGGEVGNFNRGGMAHDYGTKKERKSNGYRRAVKFEDESQYDDSDDVIVIKEENDDEFQSETDFHSRTSTSLDFSHSGCEANCYKILPNSGQNFVLSFADVGLDDRSNDNDFGAYASEVSPVASCPSVKKAYNYVANDSEYSQNNTDPEFLPKAWRNRRCGSRRDKTVTRSKIERKYQPAKSIVSKYRQQQMQQQLQQPSSSSLIVVKSLHECGYPGCGKQFRHRRDLLRHQTQKHGRMPTKFLRFQKVWSRVGSSYDAEQFDAGLEYD